MTLDLTQYVRINVGYTSMILQAHRDEVRIVISESKPALNNTAFMSLGGGDDPLPLPIINTNVWVLAVSDKSSLIVTESDTSFATEETVSQLVMAITNAIDSTAYDLNAAAFSETTNITKDYILDNIELNFSTTEVKTITITSADGTILWGGSVDTSTSNLGYNTTKRNFFLSLGRGFNANENITVAVTQLSSAGIMDCILKVKSGTNTLVGDPVVQGLDQILGGNQPLPVDRGGRYIPVILGDHTRIHEGFAYITSGKVTGLNNGDNFDILLKNPSGNFPHFRVFTFESDKAPADIVLYQEPTISSDGSPMTLVNLDHNSLNTNNLEFFSAPTITDVGTVKEDRGILGAKNEGGTALSLTVEHVLKGGVATNYLLRFTAGANSTTMRYYIFYYETSA